MTQDTPIEQQIREMLVERLFLKISPEEIDENAPLVEKLGVDSVQVLEIVVGLEEVYGISFEDDEFDIEIFKTVKSIADFVRSKKGKTA